MVVKGLNSFLNNNKNILGKRIDLHQAKLVIDANQLAFHLLKDCRELTALRKATDEFFQKLLKCEITPILVFDGSYNGIPDYTDTKAVPAQDTNTYHSARLELIKAKQRLRIGKDFKEHQPSKVRTVTPWAIIDVFSRRCDELGLERHQVPYDANVRIARLSFDLKCHILTNDGDYFNYPPRFSKRGFIILDYFNPSDILTAWGSGRMAINCHAFSQQSISSLNSFLEFDNTRLLTMLLDDDYVTSEICDRVLRIHRDEQENDADVGHRDDDDDDDEFGHLITNDNLDHLRIAKFLWWSQDKRDKSQDECLYEILAASKDDDKKRIEELGRVFSKSYDIYTDEDFTKQLEHIYPSSEVEPSQIEENQTPVAYLNKVARRNCAVYSLVLNMIFTQTCESCPPSQPDMEDQYKLDYDLPTRVKCKHYSLALALLRPLDDKPVDGCKPIYKKRSYILRDSIENVSVNLVAPRRPWFVLYNRRCNDRFDCYAAVALEEGIKRELMLIMIDMKPNQMNGLTHSLSKVLSGLFVQEATLCFSLANTSDANFVCALMMTIYYHAALSGNTNDDVFSRVRGDDDLIQRLGSYSTSTTNAEDDLLIDKSITLTIRKLLYAYECYSLLNSLLDDALHVPKLETFFNATLIYRLTDAFKSGKLSMNDLCANKPKLVDVSRKMMSIKFCVNKGPW